MSEDMTLYIVSHKLENVEVVSVNNPAAFAKPVSDWMAKTMQENYTFGTPAGTRHLTMSIGKYTMDVYSSDKNDEDFETLVFTRDDGFRFKLDQLRIMNLNVVA